MKLLLAIFTFVAYLLGTQAGAQTFSNGVSDSLKTLLSTTQHPYLRQRDLRPEIDALRAFYQEHAYLPVWEQAGHPGPQALRLLQHLQHAEDDGLRPADYDVELLESKLRDGQTGHDAAERAALDVALSTVALRFAKDLHYGRIAPSRVGFDLDKPREPLDFPALIDRLVEANDPAAVFASIEPPFHHYRLLKSALGTYRQLARDARLAPLPEFAPKSIKPGEPYAGAVALRQRLLILGDLMPDAVAGGDVLDAALVEGLRRLQERHGLAPDGALGKRTLAALNTPFANRVRQIELTLERWRWLPEFSAPSIIVNIPQFRLFAFRTNADHEEDMLSMEVVVGQAYKRTRTPVFLDQLEFVVFRPYWDVPHSIALREILPALSRDPNYLTKNHMELVRGQSDNSPVMPATAENLAALARGELRVRQAPGADNALGEIKFMMPNRYNVYLHSTPARELFKQPRRAFSHGCIRVSDPAALASYVLRNQPDEWTQASITEAMNGEPNRRVPLATPIQVMILYGTAVATEKGRVFFFDDVYGYDQRLEGLLATAESNGSGF